MKNTLTKFMAVGIITFAMYAPLAHSKDAALEEQAYTLGTQAYIYGYTL